MLKIGPAFLKKAFSYFFHATLNNLIIDLSSETDPWQIKTKEVLSDIYNHLISPNIYTELFIQSNMYRLSAYLMEFYQNSTDINDTSQYQSYIATKKMDDVFQHIFSNYYEPLTVDDMAKFTGYTKEYFCKIFRQLSGETFHKFLCRVRMEQAKFLLANTTLSISEIASTVGISEHKTFCAVFKKFTQTTPTDYRKRYSEK